MSDINEYVEEAALESILCKLPLAERMLLEARLAGR